MDISFTFTTGFIGDPAGTVTRTTYEVLPPPVDEAWAMVLAPFRFWPVPTVTGLTRRKIGYLPGCDTAVVTFRFDRPVTAWAIRVNSRSHLDGTEVEQWGVRGAGFGVQPFGTSYFGWADPTVNGGAAVISDDDLLQGENRVAIYGRGLDGTWTPPVGVAA